MKLTPQQKEQLRRPRPLLGLFIIGVLGLPWFLLLQGGIKTRRQQSQMDLRAAAFLAQLPTYERNQSAKQFDQLAADLGFMPNDSSNLRLRVNLEARRAYGQIDALLGSFLDVQTNQLSGPLEAPPPKLQAYLEQYAQPIATVRMHLLQSEAPHWNLIFEQMFDSSYPFPGFVNVRNLQRVLLLSALNDHYRGQQAEMLSSLEASWRLNQALLQRPDVVSQILVSTVSQQQAGLLRHVDDVPKRWQARLAQQAQRQSVIGAHQFDTWLQYKIGQRSWRAIMHRSSAASGSISMPSATLFSTLSYWFSPAYVLQLRAIDTTETTHRMLNQLEDLDVCSTTQQAAEQVLAAEKTATWNSSTALAPAFLARRWKVAGDRALALELTQHVLHIKQSFPQRQWPEQLPKIAAKACSEADWVYHHSEDNIITLSLSNEPLSTSHETALEAPEPILFRYQFSGQ